MASNQTGTSSAAAAIQGAARARVRTNSDRPQAPQPPGVPQVTNLRAVLAGLGAPERDLERIRLSRGGAKTVYVGTLTDATVQIMLERLTGTRLHAGSLGAALRTALAAVGMHDYETAKVVDRYDPLTEQRYVHVGSLSYASVAALSVSLTEAQAVCGWCTMPSDDLQDVQQATGRAIAKACQSCVEVHRLDSPEPGNGAPDPLMVVGPHGPVRRPIPARSN